MVQGYFLSSYSARKLGLRTTGHAGGSHNLTLTEPPRRSRATISTRCCASCSRGLFVIELMGQGVNYVTGDYSRGAAGFWVESGRIAYPVHEITIAGNLGDDAARASSRSAPTRYTHGQQDHRLGADRAHEDRRPLTPSIVRACSTPHCRFSPDTHQRVNTVGLAGAQILESAGFYPGRLFI